MPQRGCERSISSEAKTARHNTDRTMIHKTEDLFISLSPFTESTSHDKMAVPMIEKPGGGIHFDLPVPVHRLIIDRGR